MNNVTQNGKNNCRKQHPIYAHFLIQQVHHQSLGATIGSEGGLFLKPYFNANSEFNVEQAAAQFWES